MFWSPSSGWKRISGHGVFQKGVGLLRTDSRDNEGNRPRRAEARLAASSYSLKTENSCWKAGIRWLVGASLWLRWYRLPAMQKTWVRSLGWEDPLDAEPLRSVARPPGQHLRELVGAPAQPTLTSHSASSPARHSPSVTPQPGCTGERGPGGFLAPE